MANDNREANDTLLEQSRRDFDAAVDATDATIAARLRAARHLALAENEDRRAWPVPARLWLPVALAAGLATVVLVPRLEPTAPESGRDIGTLAAADLEILLGEEELEMIAELEFYEWLDLQEGSIEDSGSVDGVG